MRGDVSCDVSCGMTDDVVVTSGHDVMSSELQLERVEVQGCISMSSGSCVRGHSLGYIGAAWGMWRILDCRD